MWYLGNTYGIYKKYIRNIHKYLWYKIIRYTDPMGRPPKAAPVFLIILYHKHLWIFLIYSLYIPCIFPKYVPYIFPYVFLIILYHKYLWIFLIYSLYIPYIYIYFSFVFFLNMFHNIFPLACFFTYGVNRRKT